MKRIRLYGRAAFMVAIASQISISVFEADFRISAGIVVFVLLRHWNPKLKSIPLGIWAGLAVFGLRLLSYSVSYGGFGGMWISFLPEILFYILYGIFYRLLSPFLTQDHLNRLAGILLISDFGANLTELYTRQLLTAARFELPMAVTLLLVALLRSGLIWIVLQGLRYYKRLLLKQEHEVRYARLVWLTAQLKSEMYWMEKNMEEIEKVMSQAYTLFESIKFNQRTEDWGEQAVTIARDVHEIKKDYALAVRGIKELTVGEMTEGGMSVVDIFRILKDSLERETRSLKRPITLEIDAGENFYTAKHYYLMSILRNLLMNSMDAIEASGKEGRIQLTHSVEDLHHCFTVLDTGPGIAQENLASIFSPGFSTKINYATGHINRGLGLSVVQNIVEKELGGSVEVVSDPGVGTAFRIVIPKADLEEPV